MQQVFIKPTSSFDEGIFEGPAEIISREENVIHLEATGSQFKLFRWNWDNALEGEKYIKLGKRCTLWDEIPHNSPVMPNSSKIDPATIQTTFLGSLDHNPNLYVPIKTGTFIDQFFSRKGGIMPGTFTMVTGDPGIGKSSVMMDILQGIKKEDPSKRVLFVSAEMDSVDMLDPDEFMSYYPDLFNTVEFLFAGDFIENEGGPSFSQALEVILNRGYDVVVFDSMIEVQSNFQMDMGISSRVEAEKHMLNLMTKHKNAQNEAQKHTAFLLIQQVKKDGEFVGSRRLEHMITAFLVLKWCVDTRGKKYMMFRKNRRGDVKRRLYFKLGKGVEYDEIKYQDEIRVGQILDDNQDIAGEMSKLELAQMLSGQSKDTEQEIEET